MTEEANNERTSVEGRAGMMPGLSSLQLKLIAMFFCGNNPKSA